MECTLTILDGAETLKKSINGCVVIGSFYKWPTVGKQLVIFVPDPPDGLGTLTTSKVKTIVSQSKVAMDFICEDGRFKLHMTSENDGLLVGR